ncbi:uncharacterized protein UTRI_02503 [Ustilago trichophora]|uniref:Uncharacterized protein n=1 Tax=Ustilago trichophora TaxID=86804 RepID=A0A5C3E9A1_9BASI|nr:uncharacterized protein UTRI_02503 [Ustilago trichophora]
MSKPTAAGGGNGVGPVDELGTRMNSHAKPCLPPLKRLKSNAPEPELAMQQRRAPSISKRIRAKRSWSTSQVEMAKVRQAPDSTARRLQNKRKRASGQEGEEEQQRQANKLQAQKQVTSAHLDAKTMQTATHKMATTQ